MVGEDNLTPPDFVTYFFRWDGGDWWGRTSHENWSLKDLAQGPHLFEVKAEDIAGNEQPVPAQYSFTVDTSPPEGELNINAGALVTGSTIVSLVFRVGDPFPHSPITHVQGSHDGITWKAKQAYKPELPWTLATGDGEKSVYVRFWDAAGNLSAPAYDTIVLDTTPPDTRLDSGPSGYVSSRSASFSFSSEANAKFQCRLDGGSYTAC